MTKIKIGIVAEGPVDCIAIQNLVLAYFKFVKQIEIAFLNLQPYVDNTSKTKFSEGGWELVYKWCISNAPIERQTIHFGNGLFDGDMDELRCDALLIHMDADICEKIGDKTSVIPVPDFSKGPKIRGEFINAVISEWLWLGAEPSDDLHLIVPAVESIEAWLVAGLSDEDKFPEKDQEIQKRLAILDCTKIKKIPVPPNIKKPNKSIKNIKKIVGEASNNFQRILDRCTYFELMISKIDKVIEGKMQI